MLLGVAQPLRSRAKARSSGAVFIFVFLKGRRILFGAALVFLFDTNRILNSRFLPQDRCGVFGFFAGGAG